MVLCRETIPTEFNRTSSLVSAIRVADQCSVAQDPEPFWVAKKTQNIFEKIHYREILFSRQVPRERQKQTLSVI